MRLCIAQEVFGPKSVAVCLALVGLATSNEATAQEGGRLDRLSAEALFNEGLRLMQANDYAPACPKLAASHRLDPGVGTLLYLADCYESQGKTASAWVTFREAVFLAREAGDKERELAALEHAEALRAKLSSLKLQMVKPPPGLSLSFDDHTLAPEVVNVPLPVDPGGHVVMASAPGYISWSQTITVAPTPAVVPITIPPLTPTQSAAPAQPPPSSAARGSSTLDALGWVAVGVGATAMVGGGVALVADADRWHKPAIVCGAGLLSVVGGTLLLVLPSDEQETAPPGANTGARRARSRFSGWGVAWQSSW